MKAWPAAMLGSCHLLDYVTRNVVKTWSLTVVNIHTYKHISMKLWPSDGACRTHINSAVDELE